MDCCTGFARFLLIFFNIIFILSGIGVLGVGIFVIADPDSKKLQQLISVDSTDQYLKRIAYVLIGFGSFVLLVGLLGFLAGLKRWKFAIILYIMFLVVIFIGELGGGIAAAVFKSKVEDGLKDTLGKALQQYNGTNPNAVVTKAWDAAQKELHCCGVSSYQDYQNKNISLPATYVVPQSCCIKNVKVTDCENAAMNPKSPNLSSKLHNTGCLTEIGDILKQNITIVIGVAIGIAMIQLLGIVLACRVWRSSDEVDKVY